MLTTEQGDVDIYIFKVNCKILFMAISFTLWYYGTERDFLIIFWICNILLN
jgi:hypothetical protein